jgi:hypothetical protein
LEIWSNALWLFDFCAIEHVRVSHVREWELVNSRFLWLKHELQKEIMKRESVQEPLQMDLVLSFPEHGFHLRFESRSQVCSSYL